LSHSLRGGAKKRKKKTYNTPKKVKHKRKKVKMAILKYYKVDSDGKIKRLRRECPVSCAIFDNNMLIFLLYLALHRTPSVVPVSLWPSTRIVNTVANAG